MKLYDDVPVALVGFLMLNDELPHSSTTTWLLERKSRNVATLALARDQGKGVARLRAYK
jgi:hypothetical protein